MTAEPEYALSPEQKYFCYLLLDLGYKNVKKISDVEYAAIYPLMYTHAIIKGRLGNKVGYEDRWCYHTYEKAKAALDAWDGTGEPTGWHRHPDSGRRVDENGKGYIER